MAIQASVSPAVAGSIGFDTTDPLTLAAASSFFARNYRFCVRYVSRDEVSRNGNAARGVPDLSESEASAILQSGLALMAVQHVEEPGWVPSAQLGQAYGSNAASYAAQGGLLQGTTLWLDLEGIAEGTDSRSILDYCNAWFAAVDAAGYQSGVYIGFDVWLSPDELYFDLKTQHYWRAEGEITDVAHCGYQMFQSIRNLGTPREFDRDVIKADQFGRVPTWMIDQGAATA
jgi:hypothetical protein